MKMKRIRWVQPKWSKCWVAEVGWLSFRIDVDSFGKYYVLASKLGREANGATWSAFESVGAAKRYVAFFVRSIVLASIEERDSE